MALILVGLQAFRPFSCYQLSWRPASHQQSSSVRPLESLFALATDVIIAVSACSRHFQHILESGHGQVNRYAPSDLKDFI